MKTKQLKLIAAAAAVLLAGAVQAQPVEVPVDSGVTIRFYPDTVRAYENVHHSLQVSMVVQAYRNGKAFAARGRYGVVGCAQGFGLISIVDPTEHDAPFGGSEEWIKDGEDRRDVIATKICLVAARAALKRRQVVNSKGML